MLICETLSLALQQQTMRVVYKLVLDLTIQIRCKIKNTDAETRYRDLKLLSMYKVSY